MTSAPSGTTGRSAARASSSDIVPVRTCCATPDPGGHGRRAEIEPVRRHAGQEREPRTRRRERIGPVAAVRKVVGRREARPRAAAAAGERDQVPEDRAARGVAAGAGTRECHGPDGVRDDLDAVEDPVGPPEGLVPVDRARQDRCGRAAVPAIGEGDEPQGQAERARGTDLVGRDARDPGAPGAPHGRRCLDDVGGIEPRAEREPGEDHDLVDGVVALDVAARVRLRVAARLRLGERVGVRAPLLAHRREDEVRRPVHDAADLADVVGGEVGRERPEDRDAATDRRLEPEGAAVLAGGRLERRAMVGDDVLVRRHDPLPGAQRGGDQRPGRLVAAHELHDDVHLGVGDEVRGRVRDDRRGHAARDQAIHELVGHARERERDAVEGREASRPFEEGAHDGPADGARAEHRDAKGGRPGHRPRS